MDKKIMEALQEVQKIDFSPLTAPTPPAKGKPNNIPIELQAMEKKIERMRRAKAGRPIGAKVGSRSPRASRCTFILPSDILQKLHTISIIDGRMYKETILDMAINYIRQWEEKEGRSVPIYETPPASQPKKNK